ncbi:hypothetical protein V8G54_034802 [Vigna mungo]|uniref:Protein kinase domain-containing protein n=1 Tax=Vigna mungo TaxID=3915 RepID=A0AAQ3MEJ3_VIGMU
MVEAGNMVISVQVPRNVTDNFSEKNILGQGDFGTIYRGELHNGTRIAVKRMKCGAIIKNGAAEFKYEIVVLTKVCHRHLMALLEEGQEPLEWNRRLTIALDVARGDEYMRENVVDLGLVRLAPEGKASIETRNAGTFGYLAPEYTGIICFEHGQSSTRLDTKAGAYQLKPQSDSVGGASEMRTIPNSEAGDIQMVEAGNMVISIQVLRNVMDNFRNHALEFKFEIVVLTKVCHRHLVALLEEGQEPLEWNRRLTIALDMARSVEYLHGLTHQSFIHRDLKSSIILLGDDMRAKVADLGLVCLASKGKASVETKIAGTFGYLAPEYAGIT